MDTAGCDMTAEFPVFPLLDRLALTEGRAWAIHRKLSRLYGREARRISLKSIIRIRALRKLRASEKPGKVKPRLLQAIARRLDLAKVEEARMAARLVKRFGAGAKDLAAQASFGFGKKVGERLLFRENFLLEDRISVRRFLKICFHDFVPCAEDWHPCVESCSRILVRHEGCTHLAHWRRAKAAPELMCAIYGHFFKGLLESVSAHQLHVQARTAGQAAGAYEEVYEII
jgi:hypothetical protein